MRRRDQDRFRKLLFDKRAELLRRVVEARSSEDEVDETEAPDLGDRALVSVSRDLLYQLTSGERDALRNVDEAIERIDKGCFGVCVNCGNSVQVARLQAVPWARHCIECQELQDRGEI